MHGDESHALALLEVVRRIGSQCMPASSSACVLRIWETVKVLAPLFICMRDSTVNASGGSSVELEESLLHMHVHCPMSGDKCMHWPCCLGTHE